MKYRQSRLWAIALWAIMAGLWGAKPAMAVVQDNCGYAYPVESYEAVTGPFGSLKIIFTANDRLMVNDKLIIEDTPVPWSTSLNRARIGLTGDDILLVTYRTDCMTLSLATLYVLDNKGNLKLTASLGDAKDSFGFFKDESSLIYWSDWACDETNQSRKDNQAYVYVFKDKTDGFVKDDRPYKDVCSAEAMKGFNDKAIQFGDMKPNFPIPIPDSPSGF
jgi:hypothetical protein